MAVDSAGDTTGAQDGEALALTDSEYEAVFGEEGTDASGDYQDGEPATGEGPEAEAPAEGGSTGEGEAQATEGEADAGSEGEAAADEGGESAEAGQGEPDAGDDGEPGQAEEPEWAKTPFTPNYDARNPDQIDADVTELNRQFEEGEVEVQEYQQKFSALERERTKAEMNQENQEQAWQHVQDAFMAANPDFATDPALHGALDATLRSLYADANYQGMSMGQYLATAKQMVDQRFGRAGESGPQSSEQPDNSGGDKGAQGNQNAGEPTNSEVAQARGGRPEAPQTLSGVPEAEGESTDRWAGLNNLSGLDYEEALAQLSPEEAERYLAEG